MLDPNARSLYTASLTPPPGMVFDTAIATTYSLEPLTLLTIPIHLALGGAEAGNVFEDNGIMILEALRRVMARLTVYTQRGKIQVPASHQVLFGLLEPVVIEVQAPRGGVFHPKLWLLRFNDLDPKEPPCLRLLILSRNLSMDRSWDLSLLLEGRPSRRRRAVNRDLADFIASLPEFAQYQVSPDRREQAARLADEVRRTDWQLPPDFESIKFHVLGYKRRPWQPPKARRLVIISPFCNDRALSNLCEQTEAAEALISRQETLAELSTETKNRFRQCLTLQEAAETDDGEDREGGTSLDTLGLHAKAYIFQNGWNTHLVMGSANATDAALLQSSNVEILVELIGKRSKVKGIDEILSPDGLGRFLEPYQSSAVSEPPDVAREQARGNLERAQKELATADLHVSCVRNQTLGSWDCHLVTTGLSHPAGVVAVRAWPITVSPEHAMDIGAIFSSQKAWLGTLSPQALTGLIAFELTSVFPEVTLRFALNLPTEGLPAERDAAILQSVIRNRQGFIYYLLTMLRDFLNLPGTALLPPSDSGASRGYWRGWNGENLLLFEELVRTYCRAPNKLNDIGLVVERLKSPPSNGEPIVPPEFLHLWQIFTTALEKINER